MKTLDEKGNTVGPFGKDLHKVKTVSLSEIDSRLACTSIKVACDVDNQRTATAVYGPQKGAIAEQIDQGPQYPSPSVPYN